MEQKEYRWLKGIHHSFGPPVDYPQNYTRYRVACDTGYPCKKEFKREIRRLLLDILVQESDYTETPVRHTKSSTG